MVGKVRPVVRKPHLPGAAKIPHIHTGFTVMDRNRLTHLCCQLKLFAKNGSLDLSRGMVAVVIQTNFPNRSHLWVAGHLLEFVSSSRIPSIRVRWMDTHSSVSTRKLFGDRDGFMTGFQINPWDQDARDTRVFCSLDDGGQVFLEGVKVQMAMRIGQ